jgi:hypothetical protein
MKTISVISLFIIFLLPHKAYAISYGKCYPTPLQKATHACLKKKESQKLLTQLKTLKEKAKKIPLLEESIKIQKQTIELLKENRRKAEKALIESERALVKHEKVNAKLNGENKKLLLSAVEYEKRANHYKSQRMTFLWIGLGIGIATATGVVVAIAIVANKKG